MVTNHDQLDRTFGALADPTRRAILARLSTGESTVGELARPFEISRPAVSKHLRVLERAGIVSSSRVGRESRFRFEPEPIQRVRSYLETVSAQWDDALVRLQTFVETE